MRFNYCTRFAHFGLRHNLLPHALFAFLDYIHVNIQNLGEKF